MFMSACVGRLHNVNVDVFIKSAVSGRIDGFYGFFNLRAFQSEMLELFFTVLTFGRNHDIK